jgi:hypothetical protein
MGYHYPEADLPNSQKCERRRAMVGNLDGFCLVRTYWPNVPITGCRERRLICAETNGDDADFCGRHTGVLP